MKQNKVFTYGRHALKEALDFAPHALTKVYLDSKQIDTKLQRQIEAANIPIAKLSEGMARSDMKSGTAHQGIIGSVSIPQLLQPYERFLESLQNTPSTSVVLLSGVQDPHNVGAIIRTAAGFGASAVLLPEVGTASVTGAVLKVSAGMAFRIPLVTIKSTKQVVADLKKRGFKIYALAGEGTTPIHSEKFEGPAAFIFGNEGSGIADEIRNKADVVLSIPIHSRTESLNVAASAAVALYAWSAAHPEALRV